MKRILTFAVALTTAFTMLRAQSPYADYYANLPVEMRQVEPLAFRNVEINIANLGAVADGKTNVGEIINKVIKKLSKQGGGHVIIPAGTWLTGPIRLYSNIDLHLEDGAILLFSSDKELYVQKSDSLRDGSKKCNACVYGSKLENVAITGQWDTRRTRYLLASYQGEENQKDRPASLGRSVGYGWNAPTRRQEILHLVSFQSQ